MKTGRLTVAAYYLDCPYCGEGIGNPIDGSHMWGVDAGEVKPGQTTVECITCGKTVKLPAALLGRAS